MALIIAYFGPKTHEKSISTAFFETLKMADAPLFWRGLLVGLMSPEDVVAPSYDKGAQPHRAWERDDSLCRGIVNH